MVVFTADKWLEIGGALFKAAGSSEPNARRVMESLVDADLAGHSSHGVNRIPQYILAIEAGHLDAASDPVIVNETASSTLVDGKWTFGQVSAELAMKKAIEKAKSQGIAVSALVGPTTSAGSASTPRWPTTRA